MSVLIKGMEMPINCKYCDLREHIVCGYTRAPVDKWKYTNKYNGRRHEACPLVEIPTPHGKLVDADALLSDDEIVQILTSNPQRTGKLIKEFAKMFVDKVNRQPSIIEAEGD